MRMCPLLLPELFALIEPVRELLVMIAQPRRPVKVKLQMLDQGVELILEGVKAEGLDAAMALQDFAGAHNLARFAIDRSEEHTSELQSLMRISYAVFCLKKNKHTHTK